MIGIMYMAKGEVPDLPPPWKGGSGSGTAPFAILI